MVPRHFLRASLVFLALLPAPLPALELPAPAVIEASGFQWEPRLQVGTGFDDNVLAQAQDVVASGLLTVSPSITGRRDQGRNRREISAAAEIGLYEADAAENYLDAGTSAHAEVPFSEVLSGGIDVSLRRDHDARGSGMTQGCLTPSYFATPPRCPGGPDVFDEAGVTFLAALGNPEARGWVTVDAGGEHKDYLNNAPRADAGDFDRMFLGSKAVWRAGGRTQVVGEVRMSRYDYREVVPASRDNRDSLLLAGVDWMIKGRTSGSFRVGRHAKDFSDPTRFDVAKLAWRLGTHWQPARRVDVNVAMARRLDDSQGVGDIVRVTTLDLKADWKWRDRIVPHAGLSREDAAYGSWLFNRDDRSYTLSAGVGYLVRRYLLLDAGISSTRMDSDAPGGMLDYQRNAVGLRADLSL